MNTCGIFVLLSAVQLFYAAANELPNCLGQFIDKAFQTDTKTVYLIGLEQLNSFEAYLSLPHPKVILSQTESIRAMDATCLVVLYLDLSNKETWFHTLSTVLKDVGKYSSKAKFIVLGDDGLIQASSLHVFRDIGNIFSHYRIPYWCFAAHSGGYQMYYAIMYAKAFVFHKEACDIDKIFGTRRALPLKNALLAAQFTISFPYTFPFQNNVLGGLDVNIFQDVFVHLEANMTLTVLDGNGLNTIEIRQLSESNLYNGQVDFMLTRKVAMYDDYEVVFIPENVYICLVVPHSFKVDLTSSLVRPFDRSVWTALGVAVGVFQFSRLLLKTNSIIGRMLASLEGNENWRTFTTIVVEWLSFVLIECYLAQVTSFFVDFRFQPEPQTLEEFFATNIPIRLHENQQYVLERMEASVAAAIREKAVSPETCAEFSADCAHLDRSVRATFSILKHQSISPASNRKISYILKETLVSDPWTYVFARGSALRDIFAVYLQRLYEAGIPQWYEGTLNEFIESSLQRHEESLRLEHLLPIWMLIVTGWVVATLVFIIELVFGHFKISF